MILKSITNPDYFKVAEQGSEHTFYGANQEWYPRKWQRLAGCGPTVASHLYFYLSHTQANVDFGDQQMSKENWVQLMEEIWRFVTPSVRGVNKTEKFYIPMFSFMKGRGLNTEYHVYEVPRDKGKRQDLSQLRSFLVEALSLDTPVAFLNLCNGEEKNLDRWHWVTILSLEYLEEENITKVKIIDAGKIVTLNLTLWYNTTTRGGGFLYFTRIDS
jgi:hypothetical protein